MDSLKNQVEAMPQIVRFKSSGNCNNGREHGDRHISFALSQK